MSRALIGRSGGRTFVVLGAALWCLAIVAAPIFHINTIYSFFSVICHQDPERSWQIGAGTLPVCVRCTAIYFGFLLGALLSNRPHTKLLSIAVIASVVQFVIAVLVVDSVWLRTATGLLLGEAVAPFVSLGVEQMMQTGLLQRGM